MELDQNSITGEIPTQLGLHTNLIEINIASNKLCNDVPSQVQALSSSATGQWQVTSGNSIGTVCGWIEDTRFPSLGATSTTIISHYSQKLSGTVPTEIGLLTDVTTVWLHKNDFTGCLPTELGNLVKAWSWFRFNSNYLSSSLPSQLGNLVKASKGFDFSVNSFSSSLPSELGSWQQMGSYFYLARNSFTSTIPTELGRLVEMTSSFSLASSSFTSSIPTELGGMHKMSAYFDLDYNAFTSSIPTELGRLSKLSFNFDLRSNSLTSTIPTELGLLGENVCCYYGFYLSSNYLCGDIPTEVQALSSGVYWTSTWQVTTGNSLGDGCDSLANNYPTSPDSTTNIYLFATQYTGTIPTEYGLLTGMTFFFMGHCQLTGRLGASSHPKPLALHSY